MMQLQKILGMLLVGLILIMVLIVACVVLLWKQRKEPDPEVTIPASVQVSPTEEKIYETTGEKICLENSPDGWLPVFADVPACAYQADQFVSRHMG